MSREHVSFIRLQEKGFMEVYFLDGMWRAITLGERSRQIHFCATSKEQLLELIAFRFPTAAIVEQAPAKKQETPHTLREIFAQGSLEQRQYARRHLFGNYVGEETAEHMRSAIRQKLAIPASPHAEGLRLKLNKDDFADVTHEELVKHVQHLPTRSKLIVELGERNTFDFSN